MNEYLDRMRRLAALLIVIAVALVFVAIHAPGSSVTSYPLVYSGLVVALVTAVFLDRFPWRRHHRNWLLSIAIVGIGLLVLVIAQTGGSASIFHPLFYFLVVSSAVYFAALPLFLITALISLASLSYLLSEPWSARSFLGSAFEIPIFFVVAFFCNLLYRHLERRTAEVEAIQKQQLDAYIELDRLKSELITTVGHELRTPLSLVLGYAELLLRRDLSAAKARPMLEAIYEGANQLAGLVEDILDFGRIERGQFSFEAGEVDLLALIADVARIAGATAKDHRVTTELPAGPFVVRGDADKLRQVVQNLLSNAVRYSPDGGTVALRAAVRDGQAQVSVTDQGIGIAADHLERVFEKFYRAQSSVMHRQPGIGLGLTICRYIVEAHGGRIWAESPGLGRGATFHFTLPLLS